MSNLEGLAKMNKFDLEERLIGFSVQIIEIVNNDIHNSRAENHLSGQLVRSGTSFVKSIETAQKNLKKHY